MPPDVPTLTSLFQRGVNRERGGPAIEQLGYTLWFDNGGGKFDRAGLQILCGCYSEAVSNACVLNLPITGPEAERVRAIPVLAGAVRNMAMAWDPDWAVATSDSFRRLMREPSKSSAFVGWVTYLSRRRGTVPPLPAPVRIEPVEDKGTLIILTPERLTASNPEHVAQGRRVCELLASAGLMHPITP
jgi:hypothetical protein